MRRKRMTIQITGLLTAVFLLFLTVQPILAADGEQSISIRRLPDGSYYETIVETVKDFCSVRRLYCEKIQNHTLPQRIRLRFVVCESHRHLPVRQRLFDLPFLPGHSQIQEQKMESIQSHRQESQEQGHCIRNRQTL